jgi:hypothetical protein
MVEVRNVYKILVRNPEGKRSLARTRSRGEDNIRMDLRETGRKDMDWMHLTQDRDSTR